MTTVSTTVKIVVSMVVVAALVATTFSSKVTESKGLKGARKLQAFGGLSVASATTAGEALSNNNLVGVISDPLSPQTGVVGTGLTTGTSFGSSSTYSPGLGNSAASGAANGFGNSTSAQVGGSLSNATPASQLFGNGFGDFAASGGGSSAFGTPLLIPGTGTPFIAGTAGTTGQNSNSKGGNSEADVPGTPDQPAVPPSIVPGLQTGGGGGGFGFTFAGGDGNVSGDAGTSNAYGTSQSAGFGSAQGASLFGNAGGSGGGTSFGTGGGQGAFVLLPDGNNTFGQTSFGGSGGGTASGGAGGYTGINPPTPVILGLFAAPAAP